MKRFLIAFSVLSITAFTVVTGCGDAGNPATDLTPADVTGDTGAQDIVPQDIGSDTVADTGDTVINTDTPVGDVARDVIP